MDMNKLLKLDALDAFAAKADRKIKSVEEKADGRRESRQRQPDCVVHDDRHNDNSGGYARPCGGNGSGRNENRLCR